MNIFKPLTTPEYFFRPRQVLHRLQCALGKTPEADSVVVTTPWGAPLRIRPHEVIGSNIWYYGVFDLVVSEAICRLLDPGETALDIGANLGQMTSLMCCRTGPGGSVLAFEPHPELFAELQFNAGQVPSKAQSTPQLFAVALSDTSGEVTLDMGQSWANNRGMSRVVEGARELDTSCVVVKADCLDHLWSPSPESSSAVLKIDVEGHELRVFQGAARTLSTRKVRDIIFEDLDPYPSPVHKFLEDRGYRTFSLHSSFWRPRLAAPRPDTHFEITREGQNYLATLDATRAVARFRPIGWKCLRPLFPPG